LPPQARPHNPGLGARLAAVLPELPRLHHRIPEQPAVFPVLIEEPPDAIRIHQIRARLARALRRIGTEASPMPAPHQFRGIGRIALIQHMLAMACRRLESDSQFPRKLLGGTARGDQFEYLSLSWREAFDHPFGLDALFSHGYRVEIPYTLDGGHAACAGPFRADKVTFV
jgi:hypothetical protein